MLSQFHIEHEKNVNRAAIMRTATEGRVREGAADVGEGEGD